MLGGSGYMCVHTGRYTHTEPQTRLWKWLLVHIETSDHLLLCPLDVQTDADWEADKVGKLQDWRFWEDDRAGRGFLWSEAPYPGREKW